MDPEKVFILIMSLTTQSEDNSIIFFQVFDCPGWDHILSYLTLPDFLSLAQSHLTLMKIVGWYLHQGHELTIDYDTIEEYPIETNNELYSNYGFCASNVVFDGVLEEDLDQLLRFFPTIQKMTLRNLDIEKEKKSVEYPRSMAALCLVNTRINYTFLCHWICEMRDLDTLYLDGNDAIEINCWVKSLTVINQSAHFYCYAVRLDLIELIVDKWSRISDKQYRNILMKLERLKILESVDSRHRHEIEALNVPGLDVFFFDLLTIETPILRLNDYCILHLKEFLSASDWMSFRETHGKFQCLKISELTVDKKILTRHPLPAEGQFYAEIGQMVSRLVLFDTTDWDAWRMLPLFVNLKELEMNMGNRMGSYLEHSEEFEKAYPELLLNVKREVLKRIPYGLIRLKLFFCDTVIFKETDLFLRLNASLNTLNLSFAVGRRGASLCLSGLENISQCKLEGLWLTKDLLVFLRVNKSHMRRLHLELFKEKKLVTELSVIIVQMKQLITYKLIWLDFDDYYDYHDDYYNAWY